MKRRAREIVAMLSAALVASCTGESIVHTDLVFRVEVTPSATTGAAPLEVTFDTTVIPVGTDATYAWDFGDGGTATEQSPTHTYTTPGSYTATLTASAAGKTAEHSIDIVVLDSLSITLTADPTTGNAPTLVTFSATVSGGEAPYTYAWDFGEGGSSTDAEPSHVYVVTGVFTVTLTITDAVGSVGDATTTVTISDDRFPVASITAAPIVGIAPLEVSFEGRAVGGDPPITYLWDFGDGNTSTTQDLNHTFTSAGTFSVVLLVTDADGDESTDTVDIGVTSNDQPIVEISADATTGIEPLTVHLLANVAGGNAPITYAWDFDDDDNVDSTLSNPTLVLDAGTHIPEVTVTDVDGDTSTDTITITVDADTEPTAAASADPTSGLAPLAVSFTCAGTGGNPPLGYHWTFGNGQSSDIQLPSHTYTQGGDYTATCTVTDADGDVHSDTVDIQVTADLTPSVTIAASPTAGVATLTVDFTSTVTGGNAPFTYAWEFGDGGTASTANPSYDYTSAGSHTATLTVTDDDGDTAQDSITISVGDASTPAVTAEADVTNGPAPLQVDLTCTVTPGTGNAPYTYHWAMGDGDEYTVQNPTHTYTTIGDYTATCTVTDSFNQTGEGTVDISAVDPNLPPVIDDLTVTNGWASTTQTCAAAGQTVIQLIVTAHDQNTPADVLSYTWTFDSVPAGALADFNNDTVNNPTFVPDVAGTYVARVVVSDGRTGTVSQAATILAEDPGRLVHVSPSTLPVAAAGVAYDELISVRVETDCGIPFAEVTPTWVTTNGWVHSSSGASNSVGIVELNVTAGCNITDHAEFAAIPGDVGTPVFSIDVEAGDSYLALIAPERDVQVHDAAGDPNPMDVLVQVSDRCGNPVTGGEEVTFDIYRIGNACFGDTCPGSPCGGGTGAFSVASVTTAGGVANLELYDCVAESVYIYLSNFSGVVTAGGFAQSVLWDFESNNGSFSSGAANSTLQYEWRYGEPTAGPGGAHSGTQAWATSLDGDYSAEDEWDARYVRRWWSLPFTGGTPVYLHFWSWHDFADQAGAYVSLGGATSSDRPAAANTASSYNGVVNGEAVWAGQSNGWRRISLDVTRWQGLNREIDWVLFLGATSTTSFGWAIDDIEIESISTTARSEFLAGPLWEGTLTVVHDGVATCDTSPAAVTMSASDRFGNLLPFSEMDLGTDGAGTKEFVSADPGWIVNDDGAGNATINVGVNATTNVSFTNSDAESVNVTLATPSGSNPTVATAFVAVTDDEVGACNDGMDNDCDGDADCRDEDCELDPACDCVLNAVSLCDEGWVFASNPGGDGVCGIPGGDETTSAWLDFDTGAKVPAGDGAADLSKGHGNCCDWHVWNGATIADTGVPSWNPADWESVTCNASDGFSYGTTPIYYSQPHYTVMCVNTADGNYFKFRGYTDCCGDIVIDWCETH